MPKMTIAWLLVYWGGIVLSFVNPVYGLVIYLFEYYLRPSLHWWGKGIPEWRFSLIVALVALVTYVLNKSNLPEQPIRNNPALKWFLAFGVNMLFLQAFAVNPEENIISITLFWKLIALYALIIAVLRTDWAFNAFIAMHVAGAGWWGWEAYTDPKRSAGRLMNVGSSDTLNDNQAAGHLLTVLPFAIFLAFMIKDKRLRGIAIASTPLIVNTFVLCNSRGAIIGMIVALLFTLILAKKGHRRRMVLATAGVVLMFFVLADPQFIARQQSTLNYQNETTAQNRITNWHAGIALLEDYPLGAGGYGFNHLSPIYATQTANARETGRISPHNTWILISSEWGIQGFIIFLAFIGSTFRMLHRIRRETTDEMAYYRSLAIQIGLIGTLAAGTFSDRLYGESIYWLCALAVVAYRIHQNSPAVEPVAEPARVGFGKAAAAGAV